MARCCRACLFSVMTETIDTLTAWLQKPDYAQGLELYEQLLGETWLLSMLRQGPDDYNRQKLYQALEETLGELTVQHQTQLSAYPGTLTSQLEEAKLLMDERTILKERLRGLHCAGNPGNEQSREWVFRILQIKELLDGIYGRQRFYDQHGYLPEDTLVDSALTPADLLARRNTVRTYITKYEAKLGRCVDGALIDKYNKKLTQFRSELHDLDNQLRAIT